MTTTTTEPVAQTAEFDAAFTSPAKFVQALEQTIRLDAHEEFQTHSNRGRTKALVDRPECTIEFLRTVSVPADNISLQVLIAELIHERTPKRKTVPVSPAYEVYGANRIYKRDTTTVIEHARYFGDAVQNAIWNKYTRIAAGLEK